MVSNIKELDASFWVKTRNSLASQQTILFWTGSIYALIPNEPKHHLFKMAGMSVSRSLANGDKGWDFTSRELTYYLDPKTDRVLRHWENPWTKEIVPVVHVANSPVQGRFHGRFPALIERDLTTFMFDLFTHYPNPLAGDKRFIDYSPIKTYQATELFKFTVPTQELLDPQTTEVSQVILSWDRIGPWLPWMKMGTKPGQLVYSAHGSKVNDFGELPQWLQEELDYRLPSYKKAPTTKLNQENMTSWRYFKRHFDAYLAGEHFPLSA
ncbi:DUF1838 domain-containing protein [Lusitaniella coriacea]|uniref:DUF1838 domain-containing protein n=1 Tax=Lusitaniella coriacea TaxID=1983105 RepID=UPI003CF31737